MRGILGTFQLKLKSYDGTVFQLNICMNKIVEKFLAFPTEAQDPQELGFSDPIFVMSNVLQTIPKHVLPKFGLHFYVGNPENIFSGFYYGCFRDFLHRSEVQILVIHARV